MQENRQQPRTKQMFSGVSGGRGAWGGRKDSIMKLKSFRLYCIFTLDRLSPKAQACPMTMCYAYIFTFSVVLSSFKAPGRNVKRVNLHSLID